MSKGARGWLVALIGLILFDAVFGLIAYHTPTMSFDGDEVLTGWANVRYVSLIIMPCVYLCAAALAGMTFAAMEWIDRGR